MNKTDWVELTKLRISSSTFGAAVWHKRRVYCDSLSNPLVCSGCGSNSPKTSKAMYEYSYLEGDGDPEIGWDGNTYCNARCMPPDRLRRYKYCNRVAYKRVNDPLYGSKKLGIIMGGKEKMDRLVSRYEELNQARGAVTVIAKEEGLTRQRVHQILQKWYKTSKLPISPTSKVPKLY